jgi:hypothetical protein
MVMAGYVLLGNYPPRNYLSRKGFQAARTNITTNLTSSFIDGRALYIGLKLPLGLLLREAHIVARHWLLATYFTFSHNFTSPYKLKATTAGRSVIEMKNKL